MSAQPSKPVVWIEQEEVVQQGVDPRTLAVMLRSDPAHGVDLRGSARVLKFSGSYDREGRYLMQATVFRSQHGVVVVAEDDMFRAGDLFYLMVHGRSTEFTVREVRAGGRPGDAPATHILYLDPK